MDATTAQYLEMHKANPTTFSGRSTRQHFQAIKGLVSQYSADSILDYGCGQGEQYSRFEADKFWGVEVALYDPGVDRYSDLPSKVFDGVICIDVLEHIDADQLLETLFKIQSLSSKFVYLVIAQFEVRDILPDGRMAHVSIFDEDYWLDIVKRSARVPTHVVFRPAPDIFKSQVLIVP